MATVWLPRFNRMAVLISWLNLLQKRHEESALQGLERLKKKKNLSGHFPFLWDIITTNKLVFEPNVWKHLLQGIMKQKHSSLGTSCVISKKPKAQIA